MFKCFTRRYTDVLPDLADKYNNPFHRSIQMKPSEVDKTIEPQAWINLYERRLLPRDDSRCKNNLLIADPVRVSIESGPFRKGYLGGWSEEIFY